jgi:NAD(P)-dependent dehydrogenase (short-subunit alcohol dehydrogenase family)
MTDTVRTAFVLGATGGIGSETAYALGRHGWKIRALGRNGRPANSTDSWEWVKGDALTGIRLWQRPRGPKLLCTL